MGPVLKDIRRLCSINFDDLPDELVEMVLGSLPLLDTFLRRDVCKKWNKIMSSSSFAKARRPWILNRNCFLPSLATRISFKAFASLVTRISFRAWAQPFGKQFYLYVNCMPPFDELVRANFIVEDTEKGLLCIQSKYYAYGKRPRIFVANPLNRSCRLLPDLLKQFGAAGLMNVGVEAVRLSVDESSYKVWIMASVFRAEQSTSKTEKMLPETWVSVYDSSSDSWTLTTRLAPHLAGIRTVCLNNDSLFIITMSGTKFNVLEYNPKNHSSTEVVIADIIAHHSATISYIHLCAFHRIFRFQDRVFLIGTKHGKELKVKAGLPGPVLLELSFCTLTWNECNFRRCKTSSKTMSRGYLSTNPLCWQRQGIPRHEEDLCEAMYITTCRYCSCSDIANARERYQGRCFHLLSNDDFCFYEPRLDTRA